MAMWGFLLCTPVKADTPPHGSIAYEVMQMDSCRIKADSKEFYLHKYNFDKRREKATREEKIEAQLIYADYLLQIDELQLAGKNRMRARDFMNGNKNIENYIIK